MRLRLVPVLLALTWLVGVELAVAGWYRWHERDLVPEARWTVGWPEGAAGFRDIEIDEGVRRTLRFDTGREAVWQLPAAPGAKVPLCFAFFFRWNSGGSSVVRARAHRPDICLPSAGWEMIADRGVRDFAAGTVTAPFRQVTFRKQGASVVAHTFFCLQEDQRRPTEQRPDLQLEAGAQPDWSITGRARVVRNGVRNLGQQVLEVVIVSPGPMSEEQAEAQFRDMLQTMIVPGRGQPRS